jgi:RHS repeat-associated protein
MMISTYDPTNRLIRVQELGYIDVTDYRISASGWRYWSKAGTANAIYSPRDGSAPLGEFTVGSFPFTWTLRRPDGSVYGRKGYSSNNEFFWTDPLGSVRVRTSNSGSLLEAHDYYPFGLDMPGRSSTGTPVRQGFTGYWRDSENGLGLYYSGARMYSPGTGRFFGVDPLAEDFATWSPYVYVFNNPVSLIDPFGLCPTGSRVGDTSDGSACITQSLPEITVTASRDVENNSNNSPWLYAATIAMVEPTPIGEAVVVTAFSLYFTYNLLSTVLLTSQSRSFDDIWKNAKQTKNPNIRTESGGYEQASKDFDSLNPTGVKSIPNGRTGELPNGETVTVRSKSTDGRPTLERHKENSSNHKKVRYDN